MRKRELHPDEALQAAVDDVKNLKPAEIAAVLKRRKIVGRPGTIGRCPLALLMHNSYGGAFVVGQNYILRRGRGMDTTEKVKTPPNLAAFVRMFDSGKFPELIQVPPRCMPRTSGTKPRSGPSGKRHSVKRGAERLQLARMANRFAK